MLTSTSHVYDCLDMRYENSHEVDHEYDADMKKSIIDSMSSEARVLWTTQVLMLVVYTFPRPDISKE